MRCALIVVATFLIHRDIARTCMSTHSMCLVDNLHVDVFTMSQPLFASFFKLDGSRTVLGSPCWPDSLSVQFYRPCLMNQFAWYFASVVGQASNPGPAQSHVRLAVVNPTAVYGKVDQILGLDADIYAISETSATSVVQKDVRRKLDKAGFKSYWSKEVAPKKVTLDNRPSYRGEAVGSAAFTRLPSRNTRCNVHTSLWESQRFSSCIIRFGEQEILFISLYGFANRHKEGIRPNDVLIASIAPFVAEVGLPFMVAGDFNEPLIKLPSFKYFLDLGVVEAFHWFRTVKGYDLPPTCCGSTRNDTVFMHPRVAEMISDMSVPEDKKFDVHTPLLVDFSLAREHEKKTLWKTPNTWAPFCPAPEMVAKHYQHVNFDPILPNEDDVNVGQVEDAFHTWSKHVEKAVDRAIHESHRIDPVRNPHKGLSPAYKGRCGNVKFRKVQPRSSVKSDRHGGFNPPCDVFHLNTKLKVRLTRRIKSLFRRLKSLPVDFAGDSSHQSSLAAAKDEWKKILSAQGYGSSWKNWILSYEAVSCLPVNLPDIDDLHLMEQITEHDCIHACRMEAKFRTDCFRCRMSVDQSDDFCKTSYSLVRAKHTETLSEVPVTWNIPAKLLRSRVGRTALRLDYHRLIPKYATLNFGDAKLEMVDQEGDKIFFRHIEGILPVSGTLQISFTAITTDEISNEFADFWSPMWLRDKRPEQFEAETWRDFDEVLATADLPVIPEIQYPIEDLDIWMEIIKKLPRSKAVGPCGWSNDELRCLPSCCIRDLLFIFRHVLRSGFGPGMMMAKTVLLSKVPVPTSMHHARPITILSCLYRLLGKFIFKVTAPCTFASER